MSKAYLALGIAVMAYGVSRLLVASTMGWQSQDKSMLADDLTGAITYSQMAAWTALEGGWLLFAACLWVTWRSDERNKSWILIVAAVCVVASCWIVRDISRAAAYGYPMLFALLACLSQCHSFQTRDCSNYHGICCSDQLVGEQRGDHHVDRFFAIAHHTDRGVVKNVCSVALQGRP